MAIAESILYAVLYSHDKMPSNNMKAQVFLMFVYYLIAKINSNLKIACYLCY